MDLIDRVNQDIAAALKHGNKFAVDTLRMLKNSLENSIKTTGNLSKEEEIKIVRKEIKSRTEAESIYREHNEEQRASQEAKEASLLKTYLPEELDVLEVEHIVDEVILKNPAANFGQLMGVVMKEIGGKADGKMVSELINNKIKGEK